MNLYLKFYIKVAMAGPNPLRHWFHGSIRKKQVDPSSDIV